MRNENTSKMKLDNGSRVAVIGGGPAGSFFSCFLLDMSHRVGIDIEVDIYEARDFSKLGPTGCNMSSCIISEPLVQILATEGINLDSSVVRSGIDSYVLHLDIGDVHIATPSHEKRIAAVHRGTGPRHIQNVTGISFDGYLLELARGRGARVMPNRVDSLGWNNDRPQVNTKENPSQIYDLLVSAAGVNSGTLKLFQNLGFGYQPPQITRAHIREYFLGRETVASNLGTSLHLFLPNLPRLDFACLVPKDEFATLVFLGHDVDDSLVQSFLDAPEVRRFIPSDAFESGPICHCSPRLNIRGAIRPYADRVVFIGDSGISRLYKDGIGAAYRTAKAAAITAIFEGVSTEDFARHFKPVCNGLLRDNGFGKVIFAIAHQMQKRQFIRRGISRMVSKEQQRGDYTSRRMSRVLWDTFTGSASYTEIFRRALHPLFLSHLLWNMIMVCWPGGKVK